MGEEQTFSRGQLKCDGTRTETGFCLSAKRTSPFKLTGASVQSTAGSRGVRISSSNAGYTMFRGSMKGTGYPLHSPVSPSLPLLCVTVCHHISTGVYKGRYNSSSQCFGLVTFMDFCHYGCFFMIWVMSVEWGIDVLVFFLIDSDRIVLLFMISAECQSNTSLRNMILTSMFLWLRLFWFAIKWYNILWILNDWSW